VTRVADRPAELVDLARRLIGDQAGCWDHAGRLPVEVLRELGRHGVLCAEVPTAVDGPGLSSVDNGELTATVGSICSSVRSVLTSQGMAAWTIQRLADQRQRESFLPRLVGGTLAAVAMSEPAAGSDLAAMRTQINQDGDSVVVDGHKVWTTAGRYADLLLVFGRFADGGGVVVIPTSAPGVGIEPVADPLGCRAAGHATVTLDSVRVPAGALLGGAGRSVALLVTSALAYGRMSVAWGCVGILRACLAEVVRHANTREQFGQPLGRHQLVARQVAELFTAERTATLTCQHASQLWDGRSPDLVTAAVLAKYVASRAAARGAASAVQVLASAGAQHSHPVARAYRDAKLMEIIEGSSEISQLLLAEHALQGAF
jgi:methoxymalonate biosynthesis protein